LPQAISIYCDAHGGQQWHPHERRVGHGEESKEGEEEGSQEEISQEEGPEVAGRTVAASSTRKAFDEEARHTRQAFSSFLPPVLGGQAGCAARSPRH
jgi:hypothetical protein